MKEGILGSQTFGAGRRCQIVVGYNEDEWFIP